MVVDSRGSQASAESGCCAGCSRAADRPCTTLRRARDGCSGRAAGDHSPVSHSTDGTFRARNLQAETEANLARRYPALERQLFEDGDVAPFVNVYVGGEDVRTLEGLETRVDGLPIILLPAMAGGS